MRGILIAGLSSLAFWMCLFAAAGMYAAVALSSKLCVYSALKAEHEANQWRLVALEQQIGRLRQVITAQEGDPSFVREQAQADFALSSSDEQHIPVDSHLTLQIGPRNYEVAKHPVALPAYMPIIRAIDGARGTGDAMLAGAAAVVIGAFTMFPIRRAAETSQSV